jgi:methylated-DNA-[protein]-cysteine S-methyltransferase
MAQTVRFQTDLIDTPIGKLLIVADHGGNLRSAGWVEHEAEVLHQLRMHYGENGFQLQSTDNPYGLSEALRNYFAGDLDAIDRLSVETAGTPFQREVWHELRKIPCGTTISYAELAQRIGRPNAIRAVGLANGSNPVPVVVPCHRVIGSDGSLTGYGGGIERKRWLLQHEKCTGFATQRTLLDGAKQLNSTPATIIEPHSGSRAQRKTPARWG